MIYKYLFSFIGLCLVLNLSAQSSIKGRLVNSDKEALVAATLSLWQEGQPTSFTTTTDLDGSFLLEQIPNGTYTFKTSYVGLKDYEQLVELDHTTLDLGLLQLSGLSNQITTIEVSGATTSNVFNPAPLAPTVATKYVVDPAQLQTVTNPTNLIEAVALVNGVQEEVACGVCFTNNISINGLPGAYTAILIDGTPMYGNLAAVYGLNGLPTTMIERIEITKGPSSTIFGSEAVAGVINVITKDPKNAPTISLDVMGTTHAESFNNLSFAQRFGKVHTMLGVSHAYVGLNEDNNGDGFGDIINFDRVSVFGKVSVERPKNRRFTIFGRYYYEDRRNGVPEFLANRNYLNLRGNDEIYGESIFTRRWEVLGTYDLPTEEYIKLDYSFSGHEQDSYYGDVFYAATQYIGFANLNWNKYVKGHGITAGLSLRYQYYDDNTIATQDLADESNFLRHQFIPGIFVQDAWDVSKKVALLYGCRLDYFPSSGLVPAPRFNLKYQVDPWTTLRLNMGTGFRLVNLFTEDHAFVTGSRQVILEESLAPERSYNASLNLNHVFSWGASQGSFTLDAFYTYFTNAIFPDYDTPNQIIYRNLDGFAQTRGFSANYSQQFSFPLAISLNYNMQWADQTERDGQGNLQTSPLEYSPLYSGALILSYTVKPWDLVIAYTGTLTGPMQLPEVFDLDAQGQPVSVARPTTSQPFGFHNLQLTKTFSKLNLSIYLGVQNLLDYRQPESPLVGFNDPNAAAGFSQFFDTAYAYSPIHGREFYLGIRWNWSAKTK